MSDSWRYADQINHPNVAKLLFQAALTAHLTIDFALTEVDPKYCGTVPDWNKVQSELSKALYAVGHPAGQTPASASTASLTPEQSAWRYPENTEDPEVVKKLLQAVLTAHATINFAKTKVNPEDFATVPDWKTVNYELSDALHAAGYPDGQFQCAGDSMTCAPSSRG